MNKKTMFKIPIIYSLRGAAALMVCLYHFIITTTGFFDLGIPDDFRLGKFGVQIFFVISGVVISLSLIRDEYDLNKFGRFLTKRLVRIEPLYLLSLVLMILYTIIRNYIPGVNPIDLRPDSTDILLHLGYLVPFFDGAKWLNPVYWTLAIEFQFYLLISLVFPLLSSGHKGRSACIAVLLLLSFLFGSPGFVFRWIALFMMGITLAFFLLEKIDRREFYSTQLILAVSQGLMYGWIDVLFGIATIFIILVFPNFKSTIGGFLGKISYSLYLLHSIIGGAFINFMTRYGHSLWSKILIVLAGLALSLFVSYIFYRLVEKPTHDLARKVSSNGKFAFAGLLPRYLKRV